MTADLDQRDLTRAEVEALPDSDLREVLLSSFNVNDTGDDIGWGGFPPMPFQYARFPHKEDKCAFIARLAVGNNDRYPPGEILRFVLNELELSPNIWPMLVAPERDASYLGMGILYQDWTLPEGHPSDDAREPADVPGAIETRFTTGISHDGIGFTVFQRRGHEAFVRVRSVGYATTDAGQADELHQVLVRLNKIFTLAYKDSTLVPDYLDDPDAEARQQTNQSEDPTTRTEMTLSELEAAPPSDIRSLALLAMEAEAKAHHTYGWDATPATVFKHHLHAGCNHDSEITHEHSAAAQNGETHHCFIALMLMGEGLAPDQQIDMLRTLISEDEETRSQLLRPDVSYTGVSVMHEAWYNSGIDNETDEGDRPIADMLGTVEIRFILGVSRAGQMFMVRRIRGHEPTVTLMTTAEQLWGGDLADSLRRLNGIFVALDSTPDNDPQPTATWDELPPALGAIGDKLTTVGLLRKEGEPREGHIYPPLPPDHPFANRLCPSCSDPLSDGRPVQTFAIAPHDTAGREACEAGEWFECVAVLVHHRCMAGASAIFTNAYLNVGGYQWSID